MLVPIKVVPVFSLDLSKVLDTLDHDILFSKLEYYGFQGLALWINRLGATFQNVSSLSRLKKCAPRLNKLNVVFHKVQNGSRWH